MNEPQQNLMCMRSLLEMEQAMLRIPVAGVLFLLILLLLLILYEASSLPSRHLVE